VTEPIQDATAETTVPTAPGASYLSRDEQALVERACLGDQRALRSLFFTYQGQVRAHLVRLLGGDPDVDDLVQTVFTRAFAALPDFRGGSALSTWLYRITANTTHNLLRQRYRRERLRAALRRVAPSAAAATTSAPASDVRYNGSCPVSRRPCVRCSSSTTTRA
jgi:RNA polymerase sigma-70 factor (ECF subfamily)